MKYLCLIFAHEHALATLRQPELDAMSAACDAYRSRLRERGSLIDARRLQPADTATTVRVRDGRVGVTDGGVTGTGEQLGGYWLIEARDLNDALAIAAAMPAARHGSVEVRPLRQYDGG